MRDGQSEIVKIYECPTHGKIENQVFTLGYFDKHRNFIQNTFCGICHFKMLQKHCKAVKEVEVERLAPPEPPRIITR